MNVQMRSAERLFFSVNVFASVEAGVARRMRDTTHGKPFFCAGKCIENTFLRGSARRQIRRLHILGAKAHRIIMSYARGAPEKTRPVHFRRKHVKYTTSCAKVARGKRGNSTFLAQEYVGKLRLCTRNAREDRIAVLFPRGARGKKLRLGSGTDPLGLFVVCFGGEYLLEYFLFFSE